MAERRGDQRRTGAEHCARRGPINRNPLAQNFIGVQTNGAGHDQGVNFSTGRSASLGTRTMACSAAVSSQARAAISCSRACGLAADSSAVVIIRLASVHRAVERTRSNSRALSMALAAAEPRVNTGARRGVGLSTGGAFMMSPACGCQQSVRLERLLSEAAADSWPHSGLAEILSIAHATPRSCGVISGTQEMRKCRSSSVVPTTSRVNPDHGTPGVVECPHHPRNPRLGGIGGSGDVPSRSCAEVDLRSGPPSPRPPHRNVASYSSCVEGPRLDR